MRIRNIKCTEGCLVCGRKAVYHHIKSFGSGGDSIPSNLMPLCIVHHQDLHSKGLNHMVGAFPRIRWFLIKNGWELDDFAKKWFNPEINKNLQPIK